MSEIGASEAAIVCTGTLPASVGRKCVGYLARQPILNRRGRVLGYELRYREVGETRMEGNAADARGILDALALFGVERFAGRHLAFIQCSEQMLFDGLFEALPSAVMVLEFPSPPEPSPKLIRACRRLRDAGFRFCLTGFTPGAPPNPLMDQIDYIKVDVQFLDTPESECFCKRANSGGMAVIADNIRTHEAYRTARTAGIKYFQGFYFCCPDLIPNGTIPTNQLYQLEILRQLFRDPLDLKTLCPLVERDPSLIYRVLRFVNSPICAVRQPVTSIELAIIILGDETFRRIATLAIQCALNRDHSPELLSMAVVRARFCADAAHLCGLEPDEQYLLGMISMLPPMLGVPMEQILPALPLRAPIRDALAGVQVQERCLLAWVEELEQDRIAECETIADRLGLEKAELARLYFSALEAANGLAATTDSTS